MAGTFSDFLELELLDQAFGALAWTAPVNVFFALADAAITDATTGTSISEPASNYARKQETNNKTTVSVSHDTWRQLHNLKQCGDSMEAVIRRLLKKN